MNKRELNTLIQQAAAQRSYPARSYWTASYSGENRAVRTGTRIIRERNKLDELLAINGTVNEDGQRSSKLATEWYVSAFEIANNLKAVR